MIITLYPLSYGVNCQSYHPFLEIVFTILKWNFQRSDIELLEYNVVYHFWE